jgi:hypothetical protein
MITLIKSKISYYRTVLLVLVTPVISVTGLFLTMGGDNPESSVAAFRVVMLTATAFFWVFYLTDTRGEKRDRFHAALPLPLCRIALGRILLIPLFWSAMVLIFMISLWIVVGVTPLGYRGRDLLILTGFVLYINAIPFLAQDLRNMVEKKAWLLAINIVMALMAVLGYLLFIALAVPEPGVRSLGALYRVFREAVYSPAGGVVLPIAGVLMNWAAVYTFLHRKSYAA